MELQDLSQEYPLSRSSSTTPWDSISDSDLLEMLEQITHNDPETSAHIAVSEETSKNTLKLEASKTFLTNCQDVVETETSITLKQGNDSCGQLQPPGRGHDLLNRIEERSEDKGLFLQSQAKKLQDCVQTELYDTEYCKQADHLSKEGDHEDDESGTRSHKSPPTFDQKCDDDIMPADNDKPKSESHKDKEDDKTMQLPSCSHSSPVIDHSPTKKRKRITPLESFRGQYLNVTDLTNQAWCEQALVYSFTRTIPTTEVDARGRHAGSSIHLARELEVHDLKNVNVTSKEDSFSVKLLNILSFITGIASGTRPIVREMPVFGMLPNSNVFASGIIDELKYNQKGELQLVELKTTKHGKEPSNAQFKMHKLQVMIYKHLFDSLVKGNLTKDQIITIYGLDAEKPLGKDILDHGVQLGLDISVLGDLLDLTLLHFQFSDLPLIDSLMIDYCSQETCTSFSEKLVEMDYDWLNTNLEHYLTFWNGEREAEGVPIEEAWKCKLCPYYEGCEWIEKKTKELTLKNKCNIQQYNRLTHY